MHTTNFLPEVDADACNGCGKCVDACPVEAMTLVSANDPAQPKRQRRAPGRGRVPGLRRLRAGLLAAGRSRCSRARPRVITPVNNAHRYVLMAVERGKLQDLIFDNRVLWSHRALAALLGSVLKLPPVKRALASEQMKSRYLEALTARRPE